MLEWREVVRLDEVGELAQLDRAGVLARLEERSNLVLRQQAVDVNGRHGESRACWHNSPIADGCLSRGSTCICIKTLARAVLD